MDNLIQGVEEGQREKKPAGQRLDKARIRMMLYIALFVADCAAVRTGFSIGSSMRGARWLAPNGIELGWLILPLHLLFALRNGAVGRAAIGALAESLRFALAAFVFAISLISLLIFFQYACPLVSRLSFGAAIGLTMLFIVIFRAVLHLLFIVPLGGKLTGELLIMDGVTDPKVTGHVFDAVSNDFVPDLQSPQMMERLATLVARYDRVVVATMPERRAQWALLLKAYNVTGEILLDQNSPLGALGVARFAGWETAIVSRGPMSMPNRLKKRAMDIVLSGVAILFFSPLLIAVAIAIKLDSDGPVFFRQVRLGRDNRSFHILKFRSMRAAASDHAGARSTSHDDDRITRIGRVLRRTSIDELPQLLNVLVGDMSIVGPRPHALGSLAGDKLFWEISERYWLRHALKPGITGLAQVRGFRGATLEAIDLEKRLQADLEYVQGWRLSRDVEIIFNTLFVLVHPRAF